MITGHKHHDEFELVCICCIAHHLLIFYWIQDKDGLHGVILLSPSVTPYGHSNPSFRVYTLDKSTYRFLDYKQYHLNSISLKLMVLPIRRYHSNVLL